MELGTAGRAKYAVGTFASGNYFMRHTPPNPDLDLPPADVLAHLGFRTVAPHPQLRDWVQCFWTIRLTQCPAQGYSERLYPDGGTTLILKFVANQLPELRFNALQAVSAMHFCNAVDLLGIRFHPGGAHHLFGMDMPSLVGGHYDIAELDLDLNNDHLRQLAEQLASGDGLLQRITLLDDFLLQQAVRRDAQAGLVQAVLRRLPEAVASIDTLSAEIGIGRRQLERRFRQETGLTMVNFRQLQRIKRARRLMSLRPDLPLVEVSLAAGFYDQAHFTRQFQQITGQSPGQYQKKKRAQKETRDASVSASARHVAKIQ
jgi:AraC-like DNA-binding protein